MKSITQISHAELLQATRTLVGEERRLTALILSHLEEIERRRLHLENHSSLFDFCRRELGYSEDQANARISAMRLSREVPEVIAKVESGEISLTHLVKAQSYFRQEIKAGKPVSQAQKKELLTALEGKSVRECERMIAERQPENAPPHERERVISAKHTEISFVADEQLKMNLNQIRAIWGHQGQLSYAELFQKMSEVVLCKIDPTIQGTRGHRSPRALNQAHSLKSERKIPSKTNQSPGAPQATADEFAPPPPGFVTPKTRTIPANVRREI